MFAECAKCDWAGSYPIATHGKCPVCGFHVNTDEDGDHNPDPPETEDEEDSE
jgi:hypothetical protein